MKHPDYNSPAELKSFLEENGMTMQKKFGQNFMINPTARKRIVDSLELSEGQSVWEVGPGLGCMTEEILSRGARLTAFEIDRGFASLLHGFFEDEEKNQRFSIVEGDVLKNWKGQIEKNRPEKLFGNLPYNIAATFIADTVSEGVTFDSCVFTVQKEVAERMVAKPGSKNYSVFSVLCQWKYDVSAGIELAPGNFWPRPNVASESVLMKKKAGLESSTDHTTVPNADSKAFVQLVHALFSSRRKTLQNNIKPIMPQGLSTEDLFTQAGISGSERAENLNVGQFERLTELLVLARNQRK